MKLQSLSLSTHEKTRCVRLKKLINLLLVFLYLVIFLKLVNELKKDFRKAQAFFLCALRHREASASRRAPKRRCSSHTFRYGYLVTT